MAEKMNDASEIYQKGLSMIKQSNETAISPQFSKGNEKLDEFCLKAAAAPTKATVFILFILILIDTRET